MQEIEQTFLNGKISAFGLAPELVVACFERTERLLGRDWITSQQSGKGLMVTIPVIDMGLRLPALDGVADAESLLNNLRKRDQNADAELTALHLFRSAHPTSPVELYPEADGRVADFRIRVENAPWTTVEVTQPEASAEKQRLQKILARFTDALSNLKNQCVLEIVFNREPTEDEIQVLCNRLPEFCVLEGPQQAKLVDDIGFLFLNQSPVNQLIENVIPGKKNIPMTGVVMFVGGGPDGGPHHQVVVRIPFTDDRAEDILRDEAKQVPKDDQGLVMIDVSHANGSFESWASVFQRRFQPNMHTRVSGVCLFEGGMRPLERGYEWLVKTQLLTNPYAKCKLSEWVNTAITQAGAKYAQLGKDVSST
ncbi:MAG: hypothetical protein LAO78_27985 [Acidobacteriia bacterium]|nr:hypothetical protein [Terriglobia bacterium]